MHRNVQQHVREIPLLKAYNHGALLNSLGSGDCAYVTIYVYMHMREKNLHIHNEAVPTPVFGIKVLARCFSLPLMPKDSSIKGQLQRTCHPNNHMNVCTMYV